MDRDNDLSITSSGDSIDFESPEIYKLMISGVKDYAIFMLDPAGNIRSWNLGAERNKGYKAEEVVGRHFSLFYTPEDRARGLPKILLNYAEKHGRVEQEGWRMRKDGSLFWADVILTAVYNKKGVLTGFAKVTRDVTEKRALLKAAEDAVRASQAKSAFLANMSHELRTPLTAIIGYAELLEDEMRTVGRPEWMADIGRIIYSSNHLLSIVSDVLDLSRVEAGKLELAVEEVDVASVLSEVAYNCESLACINGNAIKVDARPSAGTICSDRKRLRQVLYNLIANASKFTQNGRITILAEDGPKSSDYGDSVKLVVTDTGVGMEQDELSRIFDKFYQVEGAEPVGTQGGGTGLGLAISRMLCEAMGGEIAVSSAPGQGSTFTVVLPRKRRSRTSEPKDMLTQLQFPE